MHSNGKRKSRFTEIDELAFTRSMSLQSLISQGTMNTTLVGDKDHEVPNSNNGNNSGNSSGGDEELTDDMHVHHHSHHNNFNTNNHPSSNSLKHGGAGAGAGGVGIGVGVGGVLHTHNNRRGRVMEDQDLDDDQFSPNVPISNNNTTIPATTFGGVMNGNNNGINMAHINTSLLGGGLTQHTDYERNGTLSLLKLLT